MNAHTHPPAPPLDPGRFDFDGDVLWVMHCADGPVPLSARAALEAFLGRELRPWTLSWTPHMVGIPRATREAAAAVLGVEPDDLTLIASTSSGLVQVAQSWPWREGDEAVLPLGEFPSNYWPWQALTRRGVEVREVALWDGHTAGRDAWTSAPPTAADDPEARLLDALGDRTRVLAVSWVRFQDGWVMDLERLARGCGERGVDLVVDGIQGAGTALPALDGTAAFVTGGHKGLLAPQGLGLLWTAPGFRERLAPTGSWLSVEEAGNFARPSTDFDRGWLTSGERLAQGVPNLVGAVLLRESLEMLREAGVERIAAHVATLRRALIDGLAGIPAWAAEAERLAALDRARRLGAIVALHHGGHRFPRRGTNEISQELDTLLKNGYGRRIYASVREGYLRVALHGWHTSQDVERLLDWLADEADGGSQGR